MRNLDRLSLLLMGAGIGIVVGAVVAMYLPPIYIIGAALATAVVAVLLSIIGDNLCR